jgi:hypothetical protein
VDNRREWLMLDITSPEIVEIQISNDGKRVWVHVVRGIEERLGKREVPEVTVLRICRIRKLTIKDERRKK